MIVISKKSVAEMDPIQRNSGRGPFVDLSNTTNQGKENIRTIEILN